MFYFKGVKIHLKSKSSSNNAWLLFMKGTYSHMKGVLCFIVCMCACLCMEVEDTCDAGGGIYGFKHIRQVFLH